MGANITAYLIIALAVILSIMAFVIYYYFQIPKAPSCYDEKLATGCSVEKESCLWKSCCTKCNLSCAWTINPLVGFRECVKGI